MIQFRAMVIFLWSILCMGTPHAITGMNQNDPHFVDYLVDHPETQENIKKIIKEIKKTEQALELLWNESYIKGILASGPYCTQSTSPHSWFLQKIIGGTEWFKTIDKNSTSLGIYDLCQSFLSTIACANGLFTYSYWLINCPLNVTSMINSLYTLPLVTLSLFSTPQKVFIDPINTIEIYKFIVNNFGHFLHHAYELKTTIEHDPTLKKIVQSFDMLDSEAWVTEKIKAYKTLQENEHHELLAKSHVDITLLKEVMHNLTSLHDSLTTFKKYSNTLLHNQAIQQPENILQKMFYSIKTRFCSYNACSAFKILVEIKGHFAQLITFVKTVDEYLMLAEQSSKK